MSCHVNDIAQPSTSSAKLSPPMQLLLVAVMVVSGRTKEIRLAHCLDRKSPIKDHKGSSEHWVTNKQTPSFHSSWLLFLTHIMKTYATIVRQVTLFGDKPCCFMFFMTSQHLFRSRFTTTSAIRLGVEAHDREFSMQQGSHGEISVRAILQPRHI